MRINAHTGRKLPELPKEGTKLRATLNLFLENKGKPIPFITPFQSIGANGKRNYSTRVIADLNDYYGFDIRMLKRGSGPIKSIWILAGRWVDDVYEDYLGQRFEEVK